MAEEIVDLKALIEDFIQAESTALELPQSLTPEQRKEAKKIVEQHPELRSESYGFGEERRLHIFKKVEQSVRVKNTFIDDWRGAGEGQEAPAFRSMPPSMPENLLERTLQRCMDLPPTSESPGADASPSESNQVELPPLPDGFAVRNTFIHIESVPTVERIVQSMPHGMFRQCLEQELSAQGAPEVPPAPSSPPKGVPSEGTLVPGTEVVIQNLVKLPTFNGLTGVVQSLDPESGRYDVLLDGPAGQCGWRWVKVKGENCRPTLPPPPENAPTIASETDDGQSTTLKLNALV